MLIDARAAVALLRSGEIVAIPTETVYGLACVLTESAARKVYAAKGRPGDNPFIVHIASPGDLGTVAAALPDAAAELARRFWPGPLTLVLPKRGDVPPAVTAGLPTVAVRCPAHPVARRIIEGAGPLAAPSANISGRPSPTRAEHVTAELDVPCVDGGSCEVGLESTVVSLCAAPRLLRPGAVTLEQLRSVLGEVLPAEKTDTPASPGQKYRHYAPVTRLIMTDGSCPPDALLLVPEEENGRFAGRRVLAYTAATLYGVLRELDAMGEEYAYVYCPKPEGLGLALCDRLRRAAGV
ncbi:MAG: threonylcarbamoyl-AMP synthase [Oscillospiraceae bacterium]|jgi:L-threonylcarbamoyladenylate synthase|nr:threonylcarbamoyl-AMP synthase [Oscillospiraceae bacterium]